MTGVSQALPRISGSYALEETDIRRYRSDGHVLLRNVATTEEITAYRPLFERVVRDVANRSDTQGRVEEYASIFQQVTNVWRIDEELRRFIHARRFAQIAAELMGVKGVRLYHDQALFKPPGGRKTPWHQDQFYWPLDTTNVITMWMPLTDAPREAGTMTFASGSHHDGPLLALSISDESQTRYQEIIEQKNYPMTDYGLSPGDASFHAGWTLHAAHANRSSSAREVITIIYFEDGVRILEPDTQFRQADLNAFLPGLKPGDLAASGLNPVLFP